MIKLVSETISVDEILREIEDPSTGGVCLFLGRVRDHAEGREVTKMDYEAYPEMALKKMQSIGAEITERWPVKKMAIVHRIGTLELGEISVAIAVATAHRDDAFAACRHAIDTLKEIVPIWKKEYFVEGNAWVEGVVPKTS